MGNLVTEVPLRGHVTIARSKPHQEQLLEATWGDSLSYQCTYNSRKAIFLEYYKRGVYMPVILAVLG